MTVRSKLSLGFVCISLTLLGLGVLAIVGLNAMSTMTMTMYDQALMGSTFAQGATVRFFKIREHFQRAITLDEDARDEILELIEEEQVRLVEDLVVMQERSLDSRVQEQVPHLIENIETWITQQTDAVETPGSVRDGERSQGSHEMTTRIESTLGFLTAGAKEAGFVRRVEAEEQGQALVITTIATIIFALFIVMGLAWMICGSIIRRLSQIEKILQQAIQGNFIVRAEVNQKDEFSQIGRYLNELIDTANVVVSGVCQTPDQASTAGDTSSELVSSDMNQADTNASRIPVRMKYLE